MYGVNVPTRLQSTSINSTTLLLSWHAPNADNVNGYHIQVFDNGTGARTTYITDNTHLLLNHLQPNHQYTFGVAAAYADGRGPLIFSQLTAATLGQHSPYYVLSRGGGGMHGYLGGLNVVDCL